jgi:hypothetical protein
MRMTCSRLTDEDLAVTDLAGVGGLGDGLDHLIELVVGDGDFDLHLGQEVDHVLGTAIQLGVAFLPAEALDLGDGDALHADLRERLAHVVQLERLDDGSDQLHEAEPPYQPTKWLDTVCEYLTVSHL